MGLPVDQRDSGQGATGAGQHGAKSQHVGVPAVRFGCERKGKEKGKDPYTFSCQRKTVAKGETK